MTRHLLQNPETVVLLLQLSRLKWVLIILICSTSFVVQTVSEQPGSYLSDSKDKEMCGDEICHRLATCVSDSVTQKSKCRCPDCGNVKYEPVCANDAVTYTNECEVNKTACYLDIDLKVVSKGFCELPDPCNRLKCYHGAYCSSTKDKTSARCVCPTSCVSQSGMSDVQELCGDNGKDYSSKCEIEKDMCPKQKPIKVKYESSCDPCEKLRASNRFPCPRNSGGICRLDGNRVPFCDCSNEQLAECSMSNRNTLVCTSQGETMSKCMAAQQACAYGKRISILAEKACDVLQWGEPVCSKKCTHYSSCNITQERQPVCTCNFKCGKEFVPVCGRLSNGELRTFNNKCEQVLEECMTQSTIATMFYGTCQYFIPAKNPCNNFYCASSSGLQCVINKRNEAECHCRTDCSTEKFSPVCGSNLMTYDSKCELDVYNCQNSGLANKKVEVILNAPCPDLCLGQSCQNYGKCVLTSLNETKCICPQLDCTLWPRNPVCGTDNKNYSNICYLRDASCRKKLDIAVQFDGFCAPDLCIDVQCPFYGVCKSNQLTTMCKCRDNCEKEQPSIPVCSTQGITYPNLCSLQRDACLKKSNEIRWANDGTCDQTFAMTQCRKWCKAPRDCLIEDITGTVNCSCKPCSLSPNPNTGGFVDNALSSLYTNLETNICTESGVSFSSLCELKYSECLYNRTYKVTQDKVICDIQNACIGDESTLIFKDDDPKGKFLRCFNDTQCPIGAFCERTTCCSIKSYLVEVQPPCNKRAYGCCKDNYSPSKGFNYEGCPEYCVCDPYGSYSDLCDENGQCLCKPGVTGKRCDVCKPFYWGFERSFYFGGCKKCVCEEYGTDIETLELEQGCDKVTGDCPCKYPARGQNCSTCPEGQTLMFMGCAQRDKSRVIKAKSCNACMFGSSCESSTTPVYNNRFYQPQNASFLNTFSPSTMTSYVTCTCPEESSCSASASRAVVCGSDGVTYPSRCHLDVNACKKQFNLRALKEKPCSDSASPCDFNPCPSSSVCVTSTQKPGFACLCPYGTEGSTCQLGAFIETPSFSGLSYLMFPFPQISSEQVEINFMTRSPDGLLFMIVNRNPDNFSFLAVYLRLSNINLKYVGVNETKFIELSKPVAIGNWTRVQLGYKQSTKKLFLSNPSTLSETVFDSLEQDFSINLDAATIAMGNVPSNFDLIAKKRILEYLDLGPDKGFDGCVSQLKINGINTPISYPSLLPFIQGLDIHSCSNTNPCFNKPCLNNGTCVAVENGGQFTCLCPKNYKGLKCEKMVPFCDVSKCQSQFPSSDCEVISRSNSLCVCPLNATGVYCEKKVAQNDSLIFMPEFFGESFIRSNPLPRNPRFKVELMFLLSTLDMETLYNKILLYNGQSGNIIDGSEYFLLYIDSVGAIRLKWSFGDIQETIRGPGPLLVNRWHSVYIEKNEGTMQLVLDGKPILFESSAILRVLDIEEPLYIGSYPRLDELKNLLNEGEIFTGFNGTIQTLSIDNYRLIGNMTWREISEKIDKSYLIKQNLNHACYREPPIVERPACMNGAQCRPNRELYKCQCLPRFQGKHCETKTEKPASNSQYQSDSPMSPPKHGTLQIDGTYSIPVEYKSKSISEFGKETLITFSLSTNSTSGVIMTTYSNSTVDYLRVELLQGFLQLGVNLGGGDFFLFSQVPVNDRKWHKITIKRYLEKISLQTDQEPPVVTYGPAGSELLDTKPIIMLGSEEEVIEKINEENKKDNVDSKFTGCIKEVILGKEPLDLIQLSANYSTNPTRGCS